MNQGGRPGFGLAHVDSLEGTGEQKERLRLILSTVSREVSVKRACELLGLGTSRFHELRRQALEGALDALAAGQPGRPRNLASEVDPRVTALEREVQQLHWRLTAAEVREELAVMLPGLGKKASTRGGKGKRASPRQRG